MQSLTNRVIIIDDDIELAELICVILLEYGYDASVFRGRIINDASIYFSSHQAEFIIIDKNLTNFILTELLEIIKQNYSPKIILISGDASETQLEALGVDAFIRKPFSPTTLLEKIKVTKSDV